MSILGKEKFKSGRQDWSTPDNLFLLLDREFNFEIDVAASYKNTKCNKFISKEEDSMKQSWNGICWLNPPYGDVGGYTLKKWIEKSYNESQKDNCVVVILIPSKTNTIWWHKYCMRAKEVRFIKGRPKFDDYIHGLPFPLSVIVFEKHNKETKFSSLDIMNINNKKSLFED